MIHLLDVQIQRCKQCDLHNGGRCKPYFTKESRHVILGEAPGKSEVENNMPFCGMAGDHLWDIMKLHGFYREQFLIINSVNCRPVDGNKNGKPTYEQINTCKKWVRKYIKVLQPKAILSLGNYAMYNILGESQGIMNMNGLHVKGNEYESNVILSIHPSMCIYRGELGKKMLSYSIGKFKEVVL